MKSINFNERKDVSSFSALLMLKAKKSGQCRADKNNIKLMKLGIRLFIPN